MKRSAYCSEVKLASPVFRLTLRHWCFDTHSRLYFLQIILLRYSLSAIWFVSSSWVSGGHVLSAIVSCHPYIIWSVTGLWANCLLFSSFFIFPFAWCSGTMPAATVDHSQRICEVWANNLEEELKRIRHVIRKYNYIAMVSGAHRDTGKRLSHFFFWYIQDSVPCLMSCLLAGHRVSRCSSQADRRIQKQRWLSVPVTAL